ncbi:MAG: hypothetical protein O7I93_02825 [Gemmatimonadetes bacterium]|nr:hypothetical protein [Gemmatimonadota bacterium]
MIRPSNSNCELNGTLTLITGPAGEPYDLAGEAIAQIIADSDCYAVQVLTSTGSVENMDALASGKADLGIVQGDIAHYARSDSLEMFADDLRKERGMGYTTDELRKVRAIMGLHTEQLLIIGRSDSGFTDALDIKPDHRIVVGVEGSGTLPNAKSVLKALGYRPQPSEEYHQSSAARFSSPPSQHGRYRLYHRWCESRVPG